MTRPNFNVWEGVYPSFAEAPVVGLGFDDPQWRTRSLASARDALSAISRGRALDYSLTQRNSVLGVLSATLLARQPRVSVLDFGGGPGFGHLVLQASLGEGIESVDYEIVEVEGVCREGAALFSGSTAPAFRETLPEVGVYDVVFTASTIQYIADWRAICRRLAALRPRYLVFADAYTGPVSSYVTLQQYYGSKIAHWILNEQEFVSEVREVGYDLALHSTCHTKILEAGGELPMANLPADKRLAHASHFIFSLSER